MKHRRPLSFLSLLPLLASCASLSEHYPLERYVSALEKSGDSFSVLQLTDIHWNMTTRFEEAEAYLNNTLAIAKDRAGGSLDLLVITGDSLLVATKQMAERLYALIDSWEIPFMVSFGNHDLQGLWEEQWMKDNVSAPKRKHSLFVNVNDDVYGDSNAVLNWTKEGKTLWQVYTVDTNHYKVKNGIKYAYDGVHPDQIEWFKEEADLAKGEAENYKPSLVFSHIPFREVIEAASLAASEREEKEKTGMPVGGDGAYVGGFQTEGVAASQDEDNFFETLKSHGGRGFFFGHDHANDAVYRYEDVILGYGVKANSELYYTDIECQGTHLSMTGGALYTLHEGGTFDIEHFYVDSHDWTSIAGWKREGL